MISRLEQEVSFNITIKVLCQNGLNSPFCTHTLELAKCMSSHTDTVYVLALLRIANRIQVQDILLKKPPYYKLCISNTGPGHITEETPYLD